MHKAIEFPNIHYEVKECPSRILFKPKRDNFSYIFFLHSLQILELIADSRSLGIGFCPFSRLINWPKSFEVPLTIESRAFAVSAQSMHKPSNVTSHFLVHLKTFLRNQAENTFQRTEN